MPSPPPVIEVQSLSDASNHAVIKLPGRTFPGTVVQGDSLRILLDLARSVRSHARQSGNPQLVEDAEELHELLQARLLHYQATLVGMGLPLPYAHPVSEDA